MNNSKEYIDGSIYSDSHSFLSMLDYFSVEMIALVIFLTSGPISDSHKQFISAYSCQ